MLSVFSRFVREFLLCLFYHITIDWQDCNILSTFFKEKKKKCATFYSMLARTFFGWHEDVSTSFVFGQFLPLFPVRPFGRSFWDFSVFDWASWGHPGTCPEATAALSSGHVMSSCLMDWNGPLFIYFLNPRLKHLMRVPWLWFCTATLNEEFETNFEVNLYMQCKCVACPLFNHSCQHSKLLKYFWCFSMLFTLAQSADCKSTVKRCLPTH